MQLQLKRPKLSVEGGEAVLKWDSWLLSFNPKCYWSFVLEFELKADVIIWVNSNCLRAVH